MPVSVFHGEDAEEFVVAAPPEGTYAATTDQSSPGSAILYQDLNLLNLSSYTLSFILYYENLANVFCTPNTLSYFNMGCNQQYRVDIMDPAAPVDSVAPGDVLASLFRTEVGAPNTLAPTPMMFDLSAFAGRTVRLRFAQVENLLPFLASVDAVSASCA